MSNAKPGKFHTGEFKAKVGLETVRGVKTINEIGQEYGVHPVAISHWKKEIQDQAKKLFEGQSRPQADCRAQCSRAVIQRNWQAEGGACYRRRENAKKCRFQNAVL